MMHAEPLVLVDLSYYVCFRYFALQRWLAITKKVLASPEEELGELLEAAFEKNLAALCKQLGCGWQHLCLCKDVPRATIWRMAHYAGYKGTRDARERDAAEVAAFTHAYERMVPRFMADHPQVRLLGAPRAEADDVIAVVHAEVRAQHPDQRVVIVTGDSDLLQLATAVDDSKTKIVDAKGQSIKGRLPPELLADNAAFVRWKVLKGDKSDNLPGVMAGLGDKRALKLALDPEGTLRQLLEGNAEARTRYELNELLMSFDRLPAYIRTGAQAAWLAECRRVAELVVVK